MNGITQEIIAPEIIQAIITQATARGLSVNDYLCEMLGLPTQELAMSGEPAPRPNEAMLAVLRETEEAFRKMTGGGSTAHSLNILHEARAGAMFGYEPTQ